RCSRDWSSDVCSADLPATGPYSLREIPTPNTRGGSPMAGSRALGPGRRSGAFPGAPPSPEDGLSLEVLQQALRTLQTASQLSPEIGSASCREVRRTAA